MKTIFVLSRTTNGKLVESYCDYHHMIALSKYETCELNEIDYQSDNVYIWSSHIGNPTQVFMHAEAKSRKCKLVFWNIEWPNWIDGQLVGFEGSDYLGIEAHVDEMWVSDKYILSLLHRFKPDVAHKIKFVFLGGHKDFGEQSDAHREIKYDFTHFMYITGIRGQKFHLLQEHGFRMAPNGYGSERLEGLLHSRWGLHLHQNSLACISPQRFMLFASYCLPIITDYCGDPSPYMVFQDALIHFDPRKSSVMNKEMRREAVEYNYYLVTEKCTFRKEVDRRVAGLWT